MNKTYLAGWFVLLLIVLAIMWKFLLNPAFSLIDDGYSLMKGKVLLQELSFSHWSRTLIEPAVGRFRPIYLLYFSLVYVLFQMDPIGLWFSQALTIWATLICLSLLIFRLTMRTWLGFGAALVWLAMPAVIENVFRLGTAEPRQILFCLLAILMVTWTKSKANKKLLLWAVIFTVLAIGTKETSIFLLPFFGWVGLKQLQLRKVPTSLLYGLVGLATICLIVISFLIMRQVLQGGYAVTNFGIDPIFILKSLKQNRLTYAHYYFILWLGLVSIIVRAGLSYTFNKHRTFIRDNWYSFGFLLLIAETIFFMVAWAFQFERYLYAPWTFIVLFSSLEMHQWLLIQQFQKKAPQSKQITLAIALGISISLLGLLIIFKGRGLNYKPIALQNIQNFQRTYDVSQLEYSIIKVLEPNQNVEKLYTTNDNYEVIYELGLYASQLGARPITVISPNSELAANEVGYEFSSDPFTAYASDSAKNKVIVGRVLDLDRVPTEIGARLIEPTLLYGILGPEQFWWIASPDASPSGSRQ